MSDMSAESQNLKIAFVFDGEYGVPNGAPNYITTLGDYLIEEGQETSYFVGHSVIESPRIHSIGRIATVRSNGNRVSFVLPTKKQTVYEVLEEVDPDVLHILMPYSPFMGAKFIEAADSETAVVGTFLTLPNSRLIEVGTHILGSLLKSTRKRFNQVISVSEPASNFAKESFGVDSDVLPCPVDLERFQKGHRLPEYDDGKINILFMGRLEERKGCQHLVSALAQLDPATLDKVRVLVAGSGGLSHKLQEQVRREGLQNTVEFLGYIQEAFKPDLLASADIATFPATGGESFGIVLIEAMAARAGVVVGGNNAGYTSVLKQVPEVLVNARSTSDFASLLNTLIKSTTLREELHAKQQQLVEQYDVSTVGGAVLDIYTSVLERIR